jgi:thiosulfate/3-mercaptopyruvate sulfurtransferase
MKNSIISSEDLKSILTNQELLILDVSPASNKAMLTAMYPDLMIKGAHIVSLKDELSDSSSPFPNTFPTEYILNKFSQSIGLSSESKVIVYDNLGVYTSPRMWWILKTMGIKEVHVLNGGISAWVDAGGETETRALLPRPDNGSFIANINTDAIRTYEQILQNTENHNFTILDARSSGRFKGESSEPRMNLASGSIVDSKNIPFKDVLKDGKLKSKQELNQIFKPYSNESELVFSCGSGITACIIHLAATQVLDSKMSIFDGSWTEWAERQKLFTN